MNYKWIPLRPHCDFLQAWCWGHCVLPGELWQINVWMKQNFISMHIAAVYGAHLRYIETCTVVCDCLRLLCVCVCVCTQCCSWFGASFHGQEKKIEFHYELIMFTELSTEANSSISAILEQRSKRHNELKCFFFVFFYFHKLSWHRSDSVTAIHLSGCYWEGPVPKVWLLLWKYNE